MDRGLVNLEELRRNFYKANFEGKSAYCFVRGNIIIKVYAKDTKMHIPVDPSKVCDFSMFKADTIVFPEEYIYENGKVAGEISKYIRSRSIDTSFNDCANLELMMKGYDKVICDLQLYSNVYMSDLCYVNVLYSNKYGFHLIDTTEWFFRDNSLKDNMYHFNFSLIEAMMDYTDLPINFYTTYANIDDVFLDNIEKYGKAGERLRDSIFMIMSNRYNFIKFLTAYMDTYRIHYGEDAKTLEDIKEFTKVLKKG